jgi:hypothetical protein
MTEIRPAVTAGVLDSIVVAPACGFAISIDPLISALPLEVLFVDGSERDRH